MMIGYFQHCYINQVHKTDTFMQWEMEHPRLKPSRVDLRQVELVPYRGKVQKMDKGALQSTESYNCAEEERMFLYECQPIHNYNSK